MLAMTFWQTPGVVDAESLRDIFVNIFMATTVHIPPALLQSVDRRAKALRISRNRVIVSALEQAVNQPSAWTPEFLKELQRVDDLLPDAVDDLVAAIKRGRRSKRARDL